MSAPLVSRRAAAALFLARQQLDRPRGRRLGAASLAAFAQAVGGIQIDSIQVVERAHHLTLHSRFGNYPRESLERLIYRRRVLFEYLAHVACFVPSADLPLHAAQMQGIPERWRRKGWLSRKFLGVANEVEAEVRANGPIGQEAFERPRHLGKAGGWWDWKPAQHALDYLWKSGRIGVHSRRNFQKRYAAIEQVLPGFATTPRLAPETVVPTLVLRTLRALGAASEKDLGAYWTWPRIPAPERRRALRELLSAGAVREVRLEGARATWFARTEDLPALEAAARKRTPSRGAVLLSPFDSFLWHRARTSALFGFDYRIEVYVPAPRRRYGYYSLPILCDGHLIGRLDAKTHREAGVLEVRHAHFERWFARGDAAPGAAWGCLDREAALAEVAEAIVALAAFVGAGEATLARATPAALRAPLARALRTAAGGRPRPSGRQTG